MKHKEPLSFKLFLIVSCLSILLLTTFGCSGKADKPEGKAPVTQVTGEEKPAPSVVVSSGNISTITDIHFNPFYDSTLCSKLIAADASQWEAIFKTSTVTGFGVVGSSETNYNLLVSSLANMAKTANKPDYIVFTGDFIAHEFNTKFTSCAQPDDDYNAFVKKTFSFLISMFTQYFPDTPVYFTLGNNDSYAGDYKLIAGGQFLKDTAPMFSSAWLKDAGNRAAFAKTYPQGGYYTIQPAGTSNTVLISVNSIFFSPKHPNPATGDPAEVELVWLEEQLKAVRANKQKAWMIMHIPPGANVYSSFKNKKFAGMWVDKYDDRFIQLMEAYAPEVTAGFCGHTHMDDWRLQLDSATAVKPLNFFRISPAVSPQFGNNPAFQQMTYTAAAFTLSDYQVYYLSLSPAPAGQLEWAKEYDFKTAYGQSMITPATLLTVYNAINSDAATRKSYMTYYGVSNTVNPELTDANWKDYWCGIANWVSETFLKCHPFTN